MQARRKKFVIFSDSLSGLLAISNCQLETGYVQKFIINYCQLVNAGNSITLIWIPCHTGIRGNELADEAAKAAFSLTVSTTKCPASNFIPELTNHYRKVWQAEWDGCSRSIFQIILWDLWDCLVRNNNETNEDRPVSALKCTECTFRHCVPCIQLP